MESKENNSIRPTIAAETARSLERRLAPVAMSAASALATIRGVAATFAVAGLGLWLLTVLSLQLHSGWKIAAAAIVFLIFLLPGFVWTLITIGVGQIARLPKRLMTIASDGHEQVQSGVAEVFSSEDGGFIKRILHVLSSIVGAREVLSESKALVTESAVLIRVFNPATIIIAGITFGGGVLIVVGVIIVGIVMRLA